MTLSIVIVNWNTRELLERCLHSIQSSLSTPKPFDVEIIVVDNASSDKSAEMVRREFPLVRLIENRHNAGFARANNQAIRCSSGNYVLLLNPDTDIGPDSLEILVRFMEERVEAGAAGCRLLSPDGSLQISCYPEPTLFREFWRIFHLDLLWPVGSYRMSRWDTRTTRSVDVLKGACLMLRREVLDQCGLLDEDFFIYSEDQDLCRRVRQHGWKIFWVPQAIVLHYGAQSTGQFVAEMFLRLYEGKIAYFRKHHGRLTAGLYKLILLAACLARQLLGPLALLKRPVQRRKDLLLTRRYRQLVRALPNF